MSEIEKALEEVRKLDLSQIGEFPLLTEPGEPPHYDIYQSKGKFPDDFCGGVGHNVAPVYNHKNLIISECPCADDVCKALNAVWHLQVALSKWHLKETASKGNQDDQG